MSVLYPIVYDSALAREQTGCQVCVINCTVGLQAGIWISPRLLYPRKHAVSGCGQDVGI